MKNLRQGLLAAALMSAAASGVAETTILDLQRFQERTSLATAEGATVTLTALNPQVNAWYLLSVASPGAATTHWHLENPHPQNQRLELAADGLRLRHDDTIISCAAPWQGEPSALAVAQGSQLPYAPLCDGRLYLRNRVSGAQTRIEQVTDFLRDHVWGGEAVIDFVRADFFQDTFAETATVGGEAHSSQPPGAPPSARLRDDPPVATVVPQHLAIGTDGRRALAQGHWYAATGVPGVYVSAIEPRSIDPALLQTDRDRVNALDPVEARALDYLVAFDLARFDLGFALGTDHPRVNWSPRPPEAVRTPGLPGPDGIGTTAPLVTNGMLDPEHLGAVAATFTGGFKRQHGAFRYGDLAQVNQGSHYGFIEHGTVFSTLQPGLATIYVLTDGTVGLTTWSEADDALLPRIRHARQNGVPLIEVDEASGISRPGTLVARWGPGNWSGSAEGELRSLRAGGCLRESGTQRFLVYGYFSTATPSAMARVFQAYGCRYAMLLDMNALEHTYLALYTHTEGILKVQHLIEGMALVDKKGGGRMAPRFLAFPDDRDFFYLTRKPQP